MSNRRSFGRPAIDDFNQSYQGLARDLLGDIAEDDLAPAAGRSSPRLRAAWKRPWPSASPPSARQPAPARGQTQVGQ